MTNSMSPILSGKSGKVTHPNHGIFIREYCFHLLEDVVGYRELFEQTVGSCAELKPRLTWNERNKIRLNVVMLSSHDTSPYIPTEY